MESEYVDLGEVKEDYFDKELIAEDITAEEIERFTPISPSNIYDLILICEYFYFYINKDTKKLIAFSSKSEKGDISIYIVADINIRNSSYISLKDAMAKIDGEYLSIISDYVKIIYIRYLNYIDSVEEDQKPFFERFMQWILGTPLPQIREENCSGDALVDEFIFGKKIIKIIETEGELF